MITSGTVVGETSVKTISFADIFNVVIPGALVALTKAGSLVGDIF